MPRMHAEDGAGPAGGAAGARYQPHRGVESQRVGLQAAEAGGLEQPEEARLSQGLDGFRGHDPRVLGFLRAVPEHREQVADALDDLVPDVLSHCGASDRDDCGQPHNTPRLEHVLV